MRVGVTAGDTAGDIATAAAAALNAVAELPVSAAVNGTIASQVDLTARWKCEAGNSVDLRHSYYAGETLPTGVGLTITPMSGGTANPDLTAAIAAMGDTWFTDIAMPFTDTASLNALGAETLRRWGPTVMQDAMGLRLRRRHARDADDAGQQPEQPVALHRRPQGLPGAGVGGGRRHHRRRRLLPAYRSGATAADTAADRRAAAGRGGALHHGGAQPAAA